MASVLEEYFIESQQDTARKGYLILRLRHLQTSRYHAPFIIRSCGTSRNREEDIIHTCNLSCIVVKLSTYIQTYQLRWRSRPFSGVVKSLIIHEYSRAIRVDISAIQLPVQNTSDISIAINNEGAGVSYPTESCLVLSSFSRVVRDDDWLSGLL